MFRQIRLLLVLVCVALTLDVGLAHDDTPGPVGERMRAMTDMGKTLKALLDAAKRKSLMGNAMMEQHIETLRHKAERIPTLFADRAMLPISEALPNIWDEPKQFRDAASAFSARVDVLQETHESGGRAATVMALRDVTRGCGSCHTAFRK